MTKLLKITVSVMAISIVGCGGENVKLKMGEKLTDLVNNQPTISRRAQQDKISQAAEDQKAAFLSELDRCGEDEATYRATSFHSGVSPYELKISDETARNENVISIEAKRISSESLKVSSIPPRPLEKNAKSSQIAQTTMINLAELIGSDSSPILIRANCFELHKNEVLKTNGRDIYIIADKIHIAGTIQTQPEMSLNLPGRNAGSIYISGIQIDFDDSALLNAKGGDISPLTEISSADRDAFFDLAAAKFTTSSIEYTASEPPARSDFDAEFLFEAWEDIIHRNIPDIWMMDGAIYGDATYHLRKSLIKTDYGRSSWGLEALGEDKVTDRTSNMNEQLRKNMINAWKNSYQFYQPYVSTSKSPIAYIIKNKVIQESFSNSTDSIAPEYEKLSGGRSGRIEIISPSEFKTPAMIFESGEGQIINFENVFSKDTPKKFPLRKKVQRTVYFQMDVYPGIYGQPSHTVGAEYTEPTPAITETSYVDLKSLNIRILPKGSQTKTYTQPMIQKNVENFRKIKDRWAIETLSPNYEKALETIRQ